MAENEIRTEGELEEESSEKKVPREKRVRDKERDER